MHILAEVLGYGLALLLIILIVKGRIRKVRRNLQRTHDAYTDQSH